MTLFAVPAGQEHSPVPPFPAGGIELAGRAEILGTAATLRWQIAADGRFRREIGGPLNEISGFDGTIFWQMDDSGIPWESQLFSPDSPEARRC